MRSSFEGTAMGNRGKCKTFFVRHRTRRKGPFWVHKAILAARSPVFAKEFKTEDPCAEVYKLEIEE